MPDTNTHKEKQETATQRTASVGQLQTFNTISKRSDVEGQENGNWLQTNPLEYWNNKNIK